MKTTIAYEVFLNVYTFEELLIFNAYIRIYSKDNL